MSAAPLPAARPPPHPGTIPQHNSLLGALIVPPVPRASRSSSSPLRGCGRSTWTHSSPTASETRQPTAENEEQGLPLPRPPSS